MQALWHAAGEVCAGSLPEQRVRDCGPSPGLRREGGAGQDREGQPGSGEENPRGGWRSRAKEQKGSSPRQGAEAGRAASGDTGSAGRRRSPTRGGAGRAGPPPRLAAAAGSSGRAAAPPRSSRPRARRERREEPEARRAPPCSARHGPGPGRVAVSGQRPRTGRQTRHGPAFPQPLHQGWPFALTDCALLRIKVESAFILEMVMFGY